MKKEPKSLAYYLLHNTRDKTYKRVLAASKKHPGYSVFEYQHGINSKASQKYRRIHEPPMEEEWIEEEIEVSPKIFCHRDYLGGARGQYYGINLYYVEEHEHEFFQEVQDLFEEEMTTGFMAMDYEKNPLSRCSADDIESTASARLRDFIFEISNIKYNRFQYEGHYQDGVWKSLNIFADFDDQMLTRILRRRR